MKNNSTEKIITFENNAVKSKISGVFIILLGLVLIIFSWKFAQMFGFNDLLAQIISISIFAIIGFIIIFAGYLFFTTSAKKLILDGSKRKLFYEEKFLSHLEKKEFDFAEIYKLTQEVTSLENTEIYTSFIVIRGGLHLEIPTHDYHDKNAQDEICRKIADFVGIPK